MSAVPGYVLAWARLPGPAEVLAEARRRLETGRLSDRGRIALDLDPAGRKNLGTMLDASWAASGKPVGVRALRTSLAAHGTQLEDLLAVMGGPLRDLPAERRERQARKAGARAEGLAELVALLDVPVPGASRQAVENALWRWVVRGAEVGKRVADVSRVMAALPAGGERLAVVAARATGDTHGLDRSRSLGRAVARFLAIGRGVADGATGFLVDPLVSADTWRETWAGVAVACDSVSARVLVLNLPLVGPAPAVRLCAATPGEPVWLSLRSLTGQFSLAGPVDVYVCENPSIVEAAADRLGDRSRPLVCLFGRPDSAAMALLRTLAQTGQLHIRADGDDVGWSIVDALLADLPSATLWRMPPGCRLYEEELLPDLLNDLAV